MGSRRARAQKIVFPSGLVLVHESAPASPAVAYHLWVKVGSAHESPSEGGVSHFLEHMLFKGTENRDAIQLNDEIENLGGNINAFTSFEQTAYHLQLSNRFWREGLNVLLDMIFHSRLDEEEMEIERQVILEELREGNDALDNVLGEKFYEVLYPNHGYGRPVIGTSDSVRGLRHPDLNSYFRRWYRPDNMILAVSGDIDWHPLVEAVRELSSDNDPTDSLMPAQVDNPANGGGLRYVGVNRGEQERILDLAFSIPGVDHPDVPVLDVLSYVLGEGEVSRLYREIRIKQQLARSVGSSMFSPFKTGKFVIQGLPYEKRDLDLLKSFLEQVRLLQEEEVSATELNRAKLNLDKEIVFNDETVEGRAKSLAYYETVFGSVEYEAKYRDQIFSVTERQLQEVTRRYLDPQKMGIALLRPQSEKVPSADEMQELVEQALHPKTQRRVTKSAPSLEADVERWKLPSGGRVVFRHFPGVRISSLYASAVGGLWAENTDINGISQLIASTVDRGTASRSDEQIAEEKIFLQAELAAVAGKSSQGQRMDVVSGNLLSALDLFADVLIDPLFEESVVEQERTAMSRELETQNDYFETRVNNLFLEAMFPGHPYGFNLLGTQDSLRRLTSDKLQKHYQAVVRPERLVIGIVADVDPDRLRSALEGVFGEISVSGSPIAIQNVVRPLEGVREIRRPIQGEKAYLQYGFRGTTQTAPDRFALDVASALLTSSGGGRLYIRLREELGLVYSIETTVLHGLDTGLFAVEWNTAPDQAENSHDEIRNEITKLKKSLVSDEELQRVKNFLIGTYEIDLQRSGTQATQLCLGELYGNEASLTDYARGISAVTAADVKGVAEKYLNFDRSVFTLLSPLVN